MIDLKRISLAILLLMGGPGCVHQPNPDPSPSAAVSNYPTAEFRAQGQLFHGLGEVALKKGAPLSSIEFKVQGYFGGTIRVDSAFCHLRKSISYAGSELVPIAFDGLARESCVIDITVASIFPSEIDRAALVYEMKGQLLVKVLSDGRPFHLASSKVPEGTDTNLFVPVDGISGSVGAVFRGCGHAYDDTVPINDGEAMVSARSVSGPEPLKRCVHEGFIDSPGELKRVSWNIWIYSKAFTPLPLPKLEFNGETLRVDADPSVAAILFDEAYTLSNKASFKLDQGQTHTLRLLTVKGRSVVCQWIQPRGEFECRQ
jgi:hypothetical protein